MGFHYGPVNITKPSGWWYTYPSEKYEFVSWDDDIPNMMGKIKVMFQTTNQPCSSHKEVHLQPVTATVSPPGHCSGNGKSPAGAMMDMKPIQ